MMNYVADFLYGATKYPCALFRPTVFLGQFKYCQHGKIQKEVHDLLLDIGFKRTIWQLVFPGQVAGLIKQIPPTNEGVNEYHIRFYRDGTIECELEVDRWSIKHWTGPRHHKEEGEKLLRNLLEEVMEAEKERAIELIGSKNFTERCVRARV